MRCIGLKFIFWTTVKLISMMHRVKVRHLTTLELNSVMFCVNPTLNQPKNTKIFQILWPFLYHMVFHSDLILVERCIHIKLVRIIKDLLQFSAVERCKRGNFISIFIHFHWLRGKCLYEYIQFQYHAKRLLIAP